MPYSLNYSALTEPLTKTDIKTYKQSGDYDDSTFKLLLLLGVIFIVGSMIWMLFTFGFAGGFFWVPASPGIGLFLIYCAIEWFRRRVKTPRRARLYKFASRSDAEFISEIYEPSYLNYIGAIFDDGHDGEISEALRFKNGIEIGNFFYFTGSTEQSSLLRRKHEWGYARVTLSKRLPHMILDSKSNNIWRLSNFRENIDRSQVVEIDENFDKHFTLYASAEYEGVAKRIFTPDVMSRLIELSSQYDIEIVEDQLFIYSKGGFRLDSAAPYEHIFSIIDLLKIGLLDQANQYFPEQISHQTGKPVGFSGQRLKNRKNWFRIALPVILIAIYIFFEYIYPSLIE